MRIGYGLTDLSERANSVYWFAVAALVVAFAADTASTLYAGADARLADRNPMIHNLTGQGYVLFSAGRAAVAVAFLSWFWPSRLEPRTESRVLLLSVPFGYRQPRRYFGAALVLVAVPLKLAAFSNNLLVLGGKGAEPALLPAGLVAGIGFSNLVLFGQWRMALRGDRDATVSPKGERK